MDYKIINLGNKSQYGSAIKFFENYSKKEKLSVDLWEEIGATFTGNDIEINIYKNSSQILIEGNDEKVVSLKKGLEELFEKEDREFLKANRG